MKFTRCFKCFHPTELHLTAASLLNIYDALTRHCFSSLRPLVCEDIQADVEDGQLQFFYLLAFVLQGDGSDAIRKKTKKIFHQLARFLFSLICEVCFGNDKMSGCRAQRHARFNSGQSLTFFLLWITAQHLRHKHQMFPFQGQCLLFGLFFEGMHVAPLLSLQMFLQRSHLTRWRFF